MDMLRYDYQTMLKRSKNSAYRAEITEMTEVLMHFLKENKLIKIDPFNEDGSLKSNLILHRSDLSDTGNALFLKTLPKWSEYIDRGGDAKNTKILSTGLNKIMSKHE
ncbi:hypothetical protein [Pseudomonas chlororaphis]|uniref:hypothetical protein n=1 Tax=Pseudomonas chlororaphis TaxID=587753 RepID=UPI000F579CB9|nr:hypothetical protein [Pseudomonas chlororaphis]